MSASLKDVDHGAKALIRSAVRASIGSTLKVGILAGDAQAEGAAPGVTVLDIATWNEFGTSRIPARSFIRAWYDEQLAKNRQSFRVLFRKVIAGEMDRGQMWELLGSRFVGEIQKRIVAHIAPPNAASTIAQKGSSTPLINTGQLRSSITYVVEA